MYGTVNKSILILIGYHDIESTDCLSQPIVANQYPIAIQHLELDNKKPRQPRAHSLRQPVLAVEVDQDGKNAKRRGNLVDEVKRHQLRHGGQEDGLRQVSGSSYEALDPI
jgi:hypothetical protein